MAAAFWLFLACVLLSEWTYPPELFDSASFVVYAQNFPKLLLTGQFPWNDAARWAPSALCWLICRLLFIPLTDMNIMRVFETMIIVWVTTGAFLWTQIADILGVRERGKWLGLILLYVNFGMIKIDIYQPILTDQTAFLIALAELYFYLSKQPGALIGVTLFGAFTFPGLEIVGLALYALPADPLQPLPDRLAVHGTRDWIASRSNVFIAGALALLTALFIFIALQPLQIYLKYGASQVQWFDHVFDELKPLSIALAALYVFLSIAWLLRCQWWSPLSRLSLRKVASAALLYLGIWIVRLSISRGHSPAYAILGFEPNPYLEFPVWLFRRPGIFPLSFSLAALTYFGVAVLFIYAYWKSATEIMQKWGLPIVIIAGMAVFMHFDPSSRHSTQVYPIMVAFAVAAADVMLNRWNALIPIAAVAVAQSRVWINLNPAGGGLQPDMPWTTERVDHYISIYFPFWPKRLAECDVGSRDHSDRHGLHRHSARSPVASERSG